MPARPFVQRADVAVVRPRDLLALTEKLGLEPQSSAVLVGAAHAINEALREA